MRIFVTGASGFAGGAIASRLLAAGHSVSAMGRSDQSIERIQSLGLTAVRCDLHNIEAVHLQGMEVVVHCAAYVDEWGTEEDFYEGNVVGTQRMLDVSKAAGVKRFIFIGTEALIFYGQDMTGITEDTPYALHSPYPYSRTKAEAERRVLSANSPTEMVTVSVRPRFVWGPGDKTVLPSLLAMINAGKFAWIGGGQYLTSTTHVTNLAHAVELALTKGRGGQAYFVTDDEVHTMKDFISRYLLTQGIQAPNKTIPTTVARWAAWSVEGVWKILWSSSKPPLVRFSIDMLSTNCTINIDKAKKELGYRPVVSVDEGMRNMPHITG